MRQLESSVDVDAPAAVVWDVLTDFEAYPEWNPLITSIEGVPERGERLRVRVEPPGGRAASFRPRVLAAREGETLEWYGKLFVQGLFDGRHGFDIEEREGGGVRFTQRETFSGLLVGVVLQEAPLLAGFDAMNDALKERAEAMAADA